jgi:hypothetical protein
LAQSCDVNFATALLIDIFFMHQVKRSMMLASTSRNPFMTLMHFASGSSLAILIAARRRPPPFQGEVHHVCYRGFTSCAISERA